MFVGEKSTHRAIYLSLLSAACVCLLGVTCPPAHAGLVDIGGGWQASWTASLDPYVNIVPLSVEDNADGGYVYIRKEATFIQPPQLGVFPSISITFEQTDVNAYEYIVIEEEDVTNNTGLPWFDFHLLILGSDAAFDPTRTAASGGPATLGWDVSPFTSYSFPNTTTLNLEGGAVPNGGHWTPGVEPNGGALFIDVVPNSEPETFTTFQLKEQPTPEPAALTMLALGAAFMLRRHK